MGPGIEVDDAETEMDLEQDLEYENRSLAEVIKCRSQVKNQAVDENYLRQLTDVVYNMVVSHSKSVDKQPDLEAEMIEEEKHPSFPNPAEKEVKYDFKTVLREEILPVVISETDGILPALQNNIQLVITLLLSDFDSNYESISIVSGPILAKIRRILVKAGEDFASAVSEFDETLENFLDNLYK